MADPWTVRRWLKHTRRIYIVGCVLGIPLLALGGILSRDCVGHLWSYSARLNGETAAINILVESRESLGEVYFVDVQLEFGPGGALYPDGPPRRAWSTWPCTSESFDPPFHVVLRQPDGSLTEPLRLEWPDTRPGDPPYAEWSHDGRSFSIVDSRDSRQLGALRPGREWRIGRAVRGAALEMVIAFFFAAALAPAVYSLTSPRLWMRRRNHECPKCGYDLRGCDEPGCPECGWLRDSTLGREIND